MLFVILGTLFGSRVYLSFITPATERTSSPGQTTVNNDNIAMFVLPSPKNAVGKGPVDSKTGLPISETTDVHRVLEGHVLIKKRLGLTDYWMKRYMLIHLKKRGYIQVYFTKQVNFIWCRVSIIELESDN